MCDICLQHPCHPRCPNAPEPASVTECICCGEKIYSGDGYYDVDGEPWCEDCMNKCYKFAEGDDT